MKTYSVKLELTNGHLVEVIVLADNNKIAVEVAIMLFNENDLNQKWYGLIDQNANHKATTTKKTTSQNCIYF